MSTIIFGDGNLGRAIAAALRLTGTEPLVLGRPANGRHAPADIGAADMVFEASRGEAVLELGRLQHPAPRAEGCEECLATGGRWLHLRVCQECGHVGCCDNSPGRHATAHFQTVVHPIIRSYEPGEDWYWCYVDEVAFELQDAPPAPSHP